MISIYVSNSISASFGRFLEGDEFRLVTIPKSKFPVGLTQTKAKTLSGIGRVAELGGLSLCNAKKTLSRADFRLIP
jgi:ribosomal protein L7/L12